VTWRERRVRELAQLINGYPFNSDDFTFDAEVPLVRIRDILSQPFETFVPREVVPPEAWVRDGDLVIGMDGDFNCTLWSRGPAALNQRVCLLRGTEANDLRFLAYALPNHLRVINDLTYSTTVKHLSSGQVKAIRLLSPDASERVAVANYLDRETAKIDALITEQGGLINALRERRSAVITRATGWGGKPPSHWAWMRLSWLFRSTGSGTTPSPHDIVDPRDDTIPWVTTGELRETVITTTRMAVTSESLANYSALKVHPAGSLLIAMYGATIGRMSILGIPAASNQACCALIGPNGCIAEFVQYSLLAARERLVLAAAGGGQPNINQDKVRSFRIPVPTVEEQRNIVSYLDEQTKKIDALIDEAEGIAAVAKERRSALIASVMAGQIDVREEVA